MVSKILMIITVALAFGCSITNVNVQQDSKVLPNVSKKERRERETTSIGPDSVFVFKCNGEVYSVPYKQINRPYFPVNLRRCLLENGFDGSAEANETIAWLIQERGKDHFLIFGRSPIFRGPQVFEALLRLADDHTPTYTHDGELSTYTVSMGIMTYCYDMIENVEGLDIRTWVDKNARQSDEEKMTLATEEPTKTLMSKLYHKMTLQAWQEGKIKLKPFGQE